MKNTSVIALIIILMIYSCSQKPPPSPPAAGISDFYIAVGSSWRYQVTDSISGLVDTITLKIDHFIYPLTIYESDFLCGIYINNQKMDSAIIKYGSNGISFLPLTSLGLFQGYEISLPLYNNQSWRAGIDSFHVSYQSTYTVFDSVYQNAYVIQTFGAGIAESEKQTIVMVPNKGIGIVYKYYQGYGIYGPGFIKKTYRLIQ